MKEKIKEFFQNEKLKNFSKKVFNRKTFKVGVIIMVLAVVLRIGFSLLFEVQGVVSKVDGNNITVVNFFTTQTINTGDYPVDSNKIKVGDRIEISKNIQGQVLSIRGGAEGRGHGNRGISNGNNSNEKNQFNGKHEKGGSKGNH
jgi:hypothetical protein